MLTAGPAGSFQVLWVRKTLAVMTDLRSLREQRRAGAGAGTASKEESDRPLRRSHPWNTCQTRCEWTDAAYHTLRARRPERVPCRSS